MRTPLSAVSSIGTLRGEIVGIDQKVRLLDGSLHTRVYLDHAACTPAFRVVMEKVRECIGSYGDVERGCGQAAHVSRQTYARAQQTVFDFTGAAPSVDAVYFGKNTSEVMDVLARSLCWEPGDVVLTMEMNTPNGNLPWHRKAQVVCAGLDENGNFDLDDLEKKLIKFAGRVKLVALNGAGSLTGVVPPIHAAAEMAHYFRAQIFVEAGQLAAHRTVSMGQPGTAGRIDFLTLSGQKLYAPLGIAALIGERRQMEDSLAKAGTPNLAGAAGLAASMELLREAGMDRIARCEYDLTTYTMSKLRAIPELHLIGAERSMRLADHLGYIYFSMDGIPAARLAAVLSFEVGIEVGCVETDTASLTTWSNPAIKKDNYRIPLLPSGGMVRVSFGCENNSEDIDRLAAALERISRGEVHGEYTLEAASGRYIPAGFGVPA